MKWPQTRELAGIAGMVGIYGSHNLSSSPGAQGWRQFVDAKRRMLAEFDMARTQARIHEVPAWHGKVAEGVFRRWLADFLPQKFGVTSGYIISQNRLDDEKTPDFDVIIYDRLNAPVLWIEPHPEITEAGRSRAIPAEWVKAVLEVKSRFRQDHVQKAVEHLLDLEPLFVNPKAEDRYASWLKEDFFCGIVFFELAAADEGGIAALKAMLQPKMPKGFIGGVILRAENNPDISAYIHTLKTNSTLGASGVLGKSLANQVVYVEDVPRGIDPENPFRGVGMRWSQAHFSVFAFDLVALLTATFQPGHLSSFHGLPISPHRSLG